MKNVDFLKIRRNILKKLFSVRKLEVAMKRKWFSELEVTLGALAVAVALVVVLLVCCRGKTTEPVRNAVSVDISRPNPQQFGFIGSHFPFADSSTGRPSRKVAEECPLY